MRVLDWRGGRKRDRRLEAAMDKVCRRRDVIGVGNMHVSAREGVFLRMRILDTHRKTRKGTGGLAV